MSSSGVICSTLNAVVYWELKSTKINCILNKTASVKYSMIFKRKFCHYLIAYVFVTAGLLVQLDVNGSVQKLQQLGKQAQIEHLSRVNL